MARIRSVHPAVFTDERWVQCSPLARIFFVGLWTDSDDQGVFEWRPVQLKMRLLPADNVAPSELLDELAAVDLIRRFDVNGIPYGAVRDFQKWQRPKKPRAVHPITPEIRVFVGDPDAPTADLFGTGGERGGTGGEKSPQMESEDGIGGGSRTRAGEDIAQIAEEVWQDSPGVARGRSTKSKVEDALRAAAKRGKNLQAVRAGLQAFYASPDATKEGGKYAAGVHRVIQGDRWESFAPKVSHIDAEASRRMWRSQMADWMEAPEIWDRHARGPRPDEPGCRIPPEVMAEFGYTPPPTRQAR